MKVIVHELQDAIANTTRSLRNAWFALIGISSNYFISASPPFQPTSPVYWSSPAIVYHRLLATVLTIYLRLNIQCRCLWTTYLCYDYKLYSCQISCGKVFVNSFLLYITCFSSLDQFLCWDYHLLASCVLFFCSVLGFLVNNNIIYCVYSKLLSNCLLGLFTFPHPNFVCAGWIYSIACSCAKWSRSSCQVSDICQGLP